jgi:hypothetical protein
LTKKILAPLTAIAAMALVAVSLIAGTATTSAAVNGVSASATTVNSGATVQLVIDADDGVGNVQHLATAGTFTACFEGDGVTACTFVSGAGTGNAIVDDTATNTNVLLVTWTAPTTSTPVTASITIIQGTSTKSLEIKVRGQADAVTVWALNAASTSTTVCQGTVSEVIRSTTATAGQANTTLCTVVTDSAGNRLPTQAVIYTTSAGTLSAASDITGATGQRANAVTLASGTTGTSGTTATITASSGGKSATTTVRFGGDPASCSVTTDPTSVSVGGSSIISVDVRDSANGPTPDGNVVNVQQANPGGGANAAILNPAPTTTGGVAKTTAIAAIPGAIAIGAATSTGNVSCTGTLMATGTVVPPTGTTPTGDGSLTAPSFGTGTVGAAVFAGGTVAQLSAQVTAAGGTSVWAQTSAGTWVRYNTLATGATAFVNNAFNAAFAGGFAGPTAVFVVK